MGAIFLARIYDLLALSGPVSSLDRGLGVCFEYLLHGGHRSNDPFLGSSICWWWWHVDLKGGLGGLWWLFFITLVDSLALPLFIYRGHVCGISWELAVNYRLLMMTEWQVCVFPILVNSGWHCTLQILSACMRLVLWELLLEWHLETTVVLLWLMSPG